MRVAAEELAVGRKPDLCERLGDPALIACGVASRRCDSITSRELRPDLERWVESGGRILRDVRDRASRVLARSSAAEAQHSLAGDANGAGRDPRSPPGMAEQSERDGRLSGAGLADEPDDLAVLDREGDVVDDLLAAGASTRP